MHQITSNILPKEDCLSNKRIVHTISGFFIVLKRKKKHLC